MNLGRRVNFDRSAAVNVMKLRRKGETAKRSLSESGWIPTFAIASVLVVIAPVSVRTQDYWAQRRTPVTPISQYHIVHGWPVLPENTILDEVSAVAVDSHDDVFVLQRGGRKWPDSEPLDESPIPVPTVFVFDGRNGLLLKNGVQTFCLCLIASQSTRETTSGSPMWRCTKSSSSLTRASFC